jgi:hypothetical protein
VKNQRKALDPQAILEHAKVVGAIRIFFVINQSIRLTSYIGTCKGCLIDQDIFFEKSVDLDSPTMLEHAKVV